MTKADKNMVNDLDYEALNLVELHRKIIFTLMYFVMKMV